MYGATNAARSDRVLSPKPATVHGGYCAQQLYLSQNLPRRKSQNKVRRNQGKKVSFRPIQLSERARRVDTGPKHLVRGREVGEPFLPDAS